MPASRDLSPMQELKNVASQWPRPLARTDGRHQGRQPPAQSKDRFAEHDR
jgi:hypothetical protein